MTSPDEYRAALDAAVKEYEALGDKRRSIDRRMAQLAQTIGTLNSLCGFVPTVFWGLTDGCRVVLKGAGHPMTPVEVRDRLEAIGFDLSRYSSSLAAIHTVLKRLKEAKELRLVELATGKFAYQSQRPPRTLALNESELAGLLRDGEPGDLDARAGSKAARKRGRK